jgi:hypothetical protein
MGARHLEVHGDHQRGGLNAGGLVYMETGALRGGKS